MLTYETCTLCPRSCGVNRFKTTGYCQSGATVKIARAALHPWEEPCISGTHGSGTVFFSGCTLRCCFCQNHEISQQGYGKELTTEQLGDIFLRLQEEGAHNINLVTATHYLPGVLDALDLVKHRLHIPVVYNCGGYESLETLRELIPYIDIWLPDLKYKSSRLSAHYSNAADYFAHASKAVQYIIEETGEPQFTHEDNPNAPLLPLSQIITPEGLPSHAIMKHGVILRHMILPGAREDSIQLLHWIHDTLPAGQYLISLMSQYTPYYHSKDYSEINRRITTYEYQKVIDTAIELGLIQGFMQEKSSAREEYTPPFDLEGC